MDSNFFRPKIIVPKLYLKLEFDTEDQVLFKIEVAFLKVRKMLVRYMGSQSSIKSLPGGGPQCTLMGLFLFLILINECGFEEQSNNAAELATRKRNLTKANHLIHLKFVDDLYIAEANVM